MIIFCRQKVFVIIFCRQKVLQQSQNKTKSDSVILCGKFQTALSGGNKSTDSGGQQSLKILSYKIMPLIAMIMLQFC